MDTTEVMYCECSSMEHIVCFGFFNDNPELAQPYSLNLPAPRQRKKRDKGFQVEFVVSDNPKPEPYTIGNKLVYEVTQEEMHDAILKQIKEAGNEES